LTARQVRCTRKEKEKAFVPHACRVANDFGKVVPYA